MKKYRSLIIILLLILLTYFISVNIIGRLSKTIDTEQASNIIEQLKDDVERVESLTTSFGPIAQSLRFKVNTDDLIFSTPVKIEVKFKDFGSYAPIILSGKTSAANLKPCSFNNKLFSVYNLSEWASSFGTVVIPECINNWAAKDNKHNSIVAVTGTSTLKGVISIRLDLYSNILIFLLVFVLSSSILIFIIKMYKTLEDL